jgi:geranylgeranyl reductase family protein
VGWEVIVVGGGPAGLAAAAESARRGARTLVLERAEHPRYKTCGGGLIGPSVAVAGGLIDIPVADRIRRVDFTLDGRRGFSRTATADILPLVRRTEFDDALRVAAEKAGAEVRPHTTVRAVAGDGMVRLADGTELTAPVVIGADGSAGVTARHVGVQFAQVDLGLEVEVPVPPREEQRWRGRVLLDWGPVPGSYAWVFPKGDVLTVGVIAARGDGARTKAYLRAFLERLGLAGIEPVHDSGHLTRCRTETSPLRRGRVIVAGDAAGLLEPWSREGISYALRSGVLAGKAAASGDLGGYASDVERTLVPSMRAGYRLLEAFSRHPGAFHLVMASPPGWGVFSRFCRGETSFDHAITRWPVRVAVKLLK